MYMREANDSTGESQLEHVITLSLSLHRKLEALSLSVLMSRELYTL